MTTKDTSSTNNNNNNNNQAAASSSTTAATTSTSSSATQHQHPTQQHQWIYNEEKIKNTPSSREMDAAHELKTRQFAALFISDLGAKIKVSAICVNTAIIYMHRFYMVHSLNKFSPNIVAVACLFLACKVEEHPTPLKKFIEAVQVLLHKNASPLSQDSDEYKSRWEEIIAHESCLIQTLGFNVLINHAHTAIIKTCNMIKASRELAQTAYLLATNSYIITNFCIRYTCETVACFCIHLACKWTGLKIPASNEGRHWYQYVNANINNELLEAMSNEYVDIYAKCDPRIKNKLSQAQAGKTAEEERQQQQQQRSAPSQSDKPSTTSDPQSSTIPRSSSSVTVAASASNRSQGASNEAKVGKEQHVDSRKQSLDQSTTSNTSNQTIKPINNNHVNRASNPQALPTQQHTQHPLSHHAHQRPMHPAHAHPQQQQHSHQQMRPQQHQTHHNPAMSINRNQNIKPPIGGVQPPPPTSQQQHRPPPSTMNQKPIHHQNQKPDSLTNSTNTGLNGNGNHINKLTTDEQQQQQQKRSSLPSSAAASIITNSSNKRANDDNNLNSAPNKMAKFVEKSVS